jgi:hypothetical protein
VHEVIESSGAPLDRRTLALFEPRFGQDLSAVRVHTDARAGAAAQAVGASAFTVGPHIAFGPGAFAPGTDEGRRLLAHELTHVLQQPSTKVPAQGELRIGEATSRWEREANEVGASVNARASTASTFAAPARTVGEGASPVSRGARVAIYRQPSRTTPDAAAISAQPNAAPASDWRIGAQAFNLILQHEFPLVNSDWYLGTRSNLPSGGGVLADLGTGSDGRVQFALSPDFAPAGQTAAQAASDPALIAAVRTQIIRVLEWRLGQGILTAQDIAAPFVSAYLRTMRPLALRALRARPTVQPAAQAELDRILAISTQIPAAAHFTAAGDAELTVNGMTVRILRDTRQGAQNQTQFRPVPDHQVTPRASTGSDGRVTTINGPLPRAPTIEVFTSYAGAGPQAGLDPLTAPSGYGRGTTAADVAAGNTSLHFHESRHGADFLDFIAAHPFPTYAGRVGMTAAAFKAAGRSYLSAVAVWMRQMGQASLCATDCVGTPDIDTSEHNTGAGVKCTTCRP